MGNADIGSMFAYGAVGAIVGPLIFGPLADRVLSTEKLLAICHIIGAVLVWRMGECSVDSFKYYALSYGLFYMPTLSLTNSLAFHHVPDRDRDFGVVRLWGTWGWIVVGLAMGQWLAFQHSPVGLDGDALLAAQAAGKADAFRLSGILGVAMAGFCLTLPHTPPSRTAESNPAIAALSAVRRQPLLTLFLLAVPVSCIHQFYFVHTDTFLSLRKVATPGWMNTVFGAGGGGLMTVGQISELFVIGLVPVMIAGGMTRKSLLSLGLIAYGVRMALFAYVDQIPLPESMVLLLGVGLHGFCFGCFIFVSFMVVDEHTSPDDRASAQNLYNLVIVGIGVIVGSIIAGRVAEWATVNDALDYTRLFSVPMWASLVCLVLLQVAYPRHSPVLESA
jgi:MFS family permease